MEGDEQPSIDLCGNKHPIGLSSMFFNTPPTCEQYFFLDSSLFLFPSPKPFVHSRSFKNMPLRLISF
jgi:hypothetical protein